VPDGTAFAGSAQRGKDVGQQARRGLEDLGAQFVERSEELAILDELSLAAEARFHVTPKSEVGNVEPIDDSG